VGFDFERENPEIIFSISCFEEEQIYSPVWSGIKKHFSLKPGFYCTGFAFQFSFMAGKWKVRLF